jgi:NTE family protein
MKTVFTLLLVGGLLVSSTPGALAQEPVPSSTPAASSTLVKPARPRVGIALGGGSARGYAHIGVIRWLEEHRIPVDFVAGTSMGGLVGGTYAMGFTPDEMLELVGDIPWREVFAPDATYRDLAFRRKEDAVRYQVEYSLGLKHGPSLPSGLFSGQPVTALLDRTAAPYATIGSFDELPIPYRSIAVDIERGDAVVFANGSLSRAMRATMSLPGVFAPVEIDGRLLVDGGLLNNVPVDVVREMGADVVIAVDVSDPLKGREEILSALGISGQSVSVMMLDNTRKTLEQADIVITPALGQYTGTDFALSQEIAEAGYAAAEAKARFLMALAVDEPTWQAYLEARKARIRTTIATPEFVAVDGASEDSEEMVLDATKDLVGKPIDGPTIDHELNALIGTGRYESISYGLVMREGKPGLVIRPVERYHAPPFFRVGLDAGNSRGTGADVNLNLRLTFLDVGAPGAEVRIDGGIGTRPFAAVEYFRPFGTTRFFVAPRFSAIADTQDLFVDGDSIARYSVNDTRAGIALGYSFNRSTELRTFYEIGYLDAEVNIGNPLLPEREGMVNTAGARLVYDNLDNPVLPTSGVRINTELRRLFDSEATPDDYWRFETTGMGFVPVRGDDIAFTIAGGGTSFDDGVVAPFDFTLGGPFRLGAYKARELRGDHYFFANLGYLYSLGSLPEVLGGRYYAGAWYETGSAFRDGAPVDVRNAVSGGFLMRTKLGLLLLGASAGEGGRGRFYFSFGPIIR